MFKKLHLYNLDKNEKYNASILSNYFSRNKGWFTRKINITHIFTRKVKSFNVSKQVELIQRYV